MFIRIEDSSEPDIYLVSDELGKYLGKVNGFDFAECIIKDKEIIENEIIFWFVEKKCLVKYLY